LEVFPDFFEILVIELVGDFGAEGFDGIPLFLLFSLHGSFFIRGSIIIITKGLEIRERIT
jgi:hypothetical protein